MELSPKLTTYSDTKQVSTNRKKLKDTLHPFWPPRVKAGYQQVQKVHKLVEPEQLTTEWKLGEDKFTTDIKIILNYNENEISTYPKLWDTKKEISRSKLLALITFFKKLERSPITNLKLHTLEQKEEITPQSSRQQEIIKLNAEINKNKTKKDKESMKPKLDPWRKINDW